MITGICRISYVALAEPKQNPSGQMKYSCCLLIPKSDEKAVADLKAAIDAAITKGKEKKWNNKVPKFRYNPLRDGDEELATGDKTGIEYAGHYFINAASDDPPGLVDERAQPLLDASKIYSGCYVRADINPFPYSNSGNNGIGWGLNNIMFIRDGERLDGKQKATDAFAAFVPETANTENDEAF